MKNKYKDSILDRALNKDPNIILPEIDDIRIVEASKQLKEIGFNVINPLELDKNKYIQSAIAKNFTNNWTEEMVNDYLSCPLNLSIFALDNDDADCVIAGAKYKTSDVIRSSIRIVGIKDSAKWVSSVFIMLSPDNKSFYTYTDCGVIPDPSSEQLSSIAYEASEIHELLSGEKSKIAFLSFSTKGSAKHYKVKKVQDAFKLFKKNFPKLECEGEIQFDAAIDYSVANKKIENSNLNGESNVFVFPDLDSANISYKITQYLARYQALGPILVGLNKPINDLSRGCNIDDIIYVTAISALQK
tara:strand:- start:138 stop:1040 length:903 start_codon:yes stop_codon:yes gene_type:complete